MSDHPRYPGSRSSGTASWWSSHQTSRRPTLGQLPVGTLRLLAGRWRWDDSVGDDLEVVGAHAWYRRGFEAKLTSLLRRDATSEAEASLATLSAEDIYDLWSDDDSDEYVTEHLVLSEPVQRGQPSAALRDNKPKSIPQSTQVVIIGVGPEISARLAADTAMIYRLTPHDFEEFICDRLSAMGLEPKRVGSIYSKDGGIDIVFWPRTTSAFPFLGAAQIKHHRRPSTREGPATVREFAGAVAGHPFNVGLLITNTSFTPDAEWYARERARLIRLRGFTDIRRWLAGRFDDESEWREIPSTIELCPGVAIRVRG